MFQQQVLDGTLLPTESIHWGMKSLSMSGFALH
jgi:hypothetical protein